jgi:hypothetical protein
MSVTSSIGLWPFSPASTIVPPQRTASIASLTGCCAIGVRSSTTSTPSPPVSSRTRSTVFSSSALIATSAPNSFASSSFFASRVRPVAIIVPAPTYRAARMAARPRCPAPITSTFVPRCTPPYSSAQRTPAPRGLYMTAISAGMSFLIGCTIEFGCRSMYSA